MEEGQVCRARGCLGCCRAWRTGAHSQRCLSTARFAAQTAQQLVADLAAAKTPQLSGALTWTANLGLSDLSSLEQESGQGGGNGNGFDPLTLLSGNYHLDVWLGTKAEHIALIEPSDQEVDIVRNHNQAWIWDSSTQNVLHLIGANPASKSSASTGVGVGSGLSALPLTPMELASRLLGHLNTSTAVSVGFSGVRSRPARLPARGGPERGGGQLDPQYRSCPRR